MSNEQAENAGWAVPPQSPKQQPQQSPPQVVLPPQQSWQPTVSDSAITGATPRWKADEIVRKRADSVFRWAMSGAGVFAAFTVFIWMSILSPGQDLVVSLLGEFGAWAFGLCGMVSLTGLGFSVYKTLQVLRDRATYARPLLSRTATDVRTMHMWPVRNITGPVVALAETGVTAVMRPGRFIWYLACVLWPLATGWFIAADVSRTYFQAGIITVLACVTTALTARLLRYVLAPEEVHRNIPVGAGRERTQPGFWSKGFIPSEATDEQGEAGALAVDKQLFEGTASEFVDDFYK